MLLMPGVVWLLAGRGIVITGSGSLVFSGYGFLKGGEDREWGLFVCYLGRRTFSDCMAECALLRTHAIHYSPGLVCA